MHKYLTECCEKCCEMFKKCCNVVKNVVKPSVPAVRCSTTCVKKIIVVIRFCTPRENIVDSVLIRNIIDLCFRLRRKEAFSVDAQMELLQILETGVVS